MPEAPTDRVFLRPIATPLPMGFLALMVATSTFAVVQLGWLAPTQGREAAVVAVLFTGPVQLLAAVFGFLARDPVAGTGMAVLGGSWAVLGAVTLTSPPGSSSPGLGVLLLAAAAALLVPTVSAKGKAVAASVMAGTAVRFAVTGVYEITGASTWKLVAGGVGLALGVLALYAAFAFELEGARGETLLPTGRAAAVLEDGEPGVRSRL